MKLKKVVEIVRIKQVINELEWEERFTVRCPEDAAEVAAKFIGDDDREVFLVMCLNTKNDVVAVHRAHVGGLNASLVIPREVFKAAILNNSRSVIFAHNHPSQNCSPSREDIEVTQRLVECGKILGIDVMDHLIVNASAKFVSLKEKGYI
ncbi:JAB domain-containing protein [Bacillus xiapuensis]|uniref:JAB domain-containing protein n=1 Tax=Bacillus xiapuensis TaxID=2014075 RepID=A0ABU6N8H4_9BACI|nr:JAB domain-containing protein [Bacillus xiapuensis]